MEEKGSKKEIKKGYDGEKLSNARNEGYNGEQIVNARINQNKKSEENDS